MKANEYEILVRAVDEGVRAGWAHAHKHTDTPSEAAVIATVSQDVLNAICEVFTFPDAPYYSDEEEARAFCERLKQLADAEPDDDEWDPVDYTPAGEVIDDAAARVDTYRELNRVFQEAGLQPTTEPAEDAETAVDRVELLLTKSAHEYSGPRHPQHLGGKKVY